MNVWTKTLSGSLLASALALGVGAVSATAVEPCVKDCKPQGDQRSGSTSDPQKYGEWAPTFFAIGVAAANPYDDDRDSGSSTQGMISTIQNLGIRSEHAYAAGASSGWRDGTFRPL